jgi:hypothetical protein
MTREQLIALLDALEAQLPSIIAANRYPSDFWMAFAAEADPIEDQTGDHEALFHERIQVMLAKHGRYIVGVEENA